MIMLNRLRLNILTFFLLFFFNQRIFSQHHPGIGFNKTVYDCGKITDKEKPVRFLFNFKNTGDVPFKLGAVNVNLRCTSLENTEKIVAPGDSGFIAGKFNPKEYSGMLNKKLTVSIMAGDSVMTISLSIKGDMNEEVCISTRANTSINASTSTKVIQPTAEIKTTPIVKEADVSQGVVFKVQIAATHNPINLKDKNYKDLKVTKENMENGLFKYTTGSFADYSLAAGLQKELIAKGFKDAFIVAFLNGKRVPIDKIKK